MKAPEYKKLCKRIYSMYRNTLDMSYFDACECADDVYFGHMSEKQLLEQLEDLANDELAV